MRVDIIIEPEVINILNDLADHEHWAYSFQETIDLCENLVEMGLLLKLYYNDYPVFSLLPLGRQVLAKLNGNDYMGINSPLVHVRVEEKGYGSDYTA